MFAAKWSKTFCSLSVKAFLKTILTSSLRVSAFTVLFAEETFFAADFFSAFGFAGAFLGASFTTGVSSIWILWTEKGVGAICCSRS